MSSKVYVGDVQPNHKEFKIWVANDGTVKTFNGTKWQQLGAASEYGVFGVTKDYDLVNYENTTEDCIGVALIDGVHNIMINKQPHSGTFLNLPTTGITTGAVPDTSFYSNAFSSSNFSGKSITDNILTKHDDLIDDKSIFGKLKIFNESEEKSNRPSDWYIPSI